MGDSVEDILPVGVVVADLGDLAREVVVVDLEVVLPVGVVADKFTDMCKWKFNPNCSNFS